MALKDSVNQLCDVMSIQEHVQGLQEEFEAVINAGDDGYIDNLAGAMMLKLIGKLDN
ncbi:Hypothetical protein FKW44_024157, partial [Caligus rogercresseyi]